MGAIKLTYQPDEITANLRIVHKKGCQDLCSQKTKTSDLLGLDCYPFGSIMPGRNYNSNTYRFGYNAGSEKDDEITGVTGSHFTTFFREFDTRIGRPWTPDPVFQPWQSPYSSMDNNPIFYNDVLGDKVGYEKSKEASATKTFFRVQWDRLTNKDFRETHRELKKSEDMFYYKKAEPGHEPTTAYSPKDIYAPGSGIYDKNPNTFSYKGHNTEGKDVYYLHFRDKRQETIKIARDDHPLNMNDAKSIVERSKYSYKSGTIEIKGGFGKDTDFNILNVKVGGAVSTTIVDDDPIFGTGTWSYKRGPEPFNYANDKPGKIVIKLTSSGKNVGGGTVKVKLSE